MATPPGPVDDIPERVDECSSDTYDAMRARLAELERRQDESVWRQQGARLVQQEFLITRLRADLDASNRREGEARRLALTNARDRDHWRDVAEGRKTQETT